MIVNKYDRITIHCYRIHVLIESHAIIFDINLFDINLSYSIRKRSFDAIDIAIEDSVIFSTYPSSS